MFKKLKFLKVRKRKKNQPEINLNSEIYKQFKVFRLPLVLIQILVLIGTLGYYALEDYTLMQAFFQTTYTMTATGFGALDENKFGTISIFFTSILMFCGAGIIAFSVAILISVVNKGTLTRLIKEKGMVYKIARLKDHYVICYHNEYTIELSKQFRSAQIPFVVVDNDPNFEEEAIKHKYPYYIIGDPHTNITMLKTHLSSARGVVALSKTLLVNVALMVSVRLFEKELKRKPYYIIASAHSDEGLEKLKKLGADMVVSPTKLMAQRVSAMAVRPDMENILERFINKKDTLLDLEEVIVPKYSWLVLRKLREAHFRDIAKAFVIGIIQKDGKYIPMPDGDTIIASESKLLMIGTSEGVKACKQLIASRQKPKEVDYVSL
ncbi:potassium channel family protein [Helicobacter cetorum]|uniref:Potassium channel protein n=1 Tax=Helicobacter cetorum (strain ATCC BAA-540 / CCUG 52418 / MIT 99-5656) TaxID=1163745 RepID=I0EQY0_HELCM|nr:NAD-binding protein [Helicobacter cetorum]AFI05349.1 potassium channel protein [Helicobacter cetorum MIT 99-5656]